MPEAGEAEHGMRLVLCDQHVMFRDAFSALLGMRGHEVVARSRTVSELVAVAAEASPDIADADVVVSDIRFSNIPGDVAVGKMRAALPETPIAILTGETDHAVLQAALDAGADGVAIKTESVDEVERLLRRVMSPRFARHRRADGAEKVWSRRGMAIVNQSCWSRFNESPTPRELEIIRLLVQGENTNRIAQVMGVGTATVRSHLQHLFIKFGTHSRLELVALAVRTGLVSDTRRPPRMGVRSLGTP